MIPHVLTISHLGEAASRVEVQKIFGGKEWDGASPRRPALFLRCSVSNQGATKGPEPVLAQGCSPQQL